MKIKFRTLIQIAGDIDASVYTDYSGRGMYGATCVGFVIGYDELPGLALAIQNAGVEDILPYREAATYSLGNHRVLYWENVQCDDGP